MSQVDILVVDDSAADRASLRIAFESTGFPVRLHFANNGRSALAMLKPNDDTATRLKPHLCVLDLKMPEVSGLDVLRTLKSDEALHAIPVIVYSGSDDPSDVRAAYLAQASGFIKKPPDIESLKEMVQVFGHFCTRILVFPQR